MLAKFSKTWGCQDLLSRPSRVIYLARKAFKVKEASMESSEVTPYFVTSEVHYTFVQLALISTPNI